LGCQTERDSTERSVNSEVDGGRGKSGGGFTGGHRRRTLGWGGPEHLEEHPGRSSSVGDDEPLAKEAAAGERCCPASLAGGLGQNAVLKVEAETVVPMHSLDGNGRRRWWPPTVSRGVGGKSEQSGSERE
jgi:hypothetical protein